MLEKVCFSLSTAGFADRFSRTSAMIVCGVTSFVGSLIIALAFYNQMWYVYVYARTLETKANGSADFTSVVLFLYRMVILGRTIVGIGTG